MSIHSVISKKLSCGDTVSLPFFFYSLGDDFLYFPWIADIFDL